LTFEANKEGGEVLLEMETAPNNMELLKVKKFRILLWLFILGAGWISAVAQSGDCWGNFRGDAALSGVSAARLPDQPAMLWNFKMDDGIKAAPVACGGIIVVGTVNGDLYGINSDGTLRWKIITENSIEAPALIVDGVVYVGNLDGALYAVDLKKGAIKWIYKTENQIMGSPAFYRKGNREVLMVGSYDYYLHGIDPATGEGLWKYETNNFINGSCALYAGMAVFGGCDGYLHMVDAISGEVKISMEISTYVASSATIDEDVAYVGDYDGRFSAVDLLDQRVNWVFENRQANLPFIASPAVSGAHVYIGNRDKYLYCLDKSSGELVWKFNTGSRVDASAVIVGDRLLAANMRGDLFLIDRESGQPGWTYELGTPVNSNPAVVDNRIYVAGEDGRLYCFGKK
jgi:outer membrane protein assembly factor BamB